ncbi:MAG: L-idonate 5-dehydrogenase [Gammaproteobacteria bacterium]|jgi:L-idonate 5-dehydrogenase
MRALVIHKAKDLRIEERQIPLPGPGQIKIKVAVGGICGSDLHYYNKGGFGPITLKEPMVPGHEFSGYVDQIGKGVEGFEPGELLVISPSRPCGDCRFCNEGLLNQCLNMRFYGSAMPYPHIQGAFQEELIVDASQCVRAEGLTPGEAAMAEPLSVALHATRRAGEMLGKRVLITGCGPIGALCIVAARRAGAVEIVVTDLVPNALQYAMLAGADKVINMAEEPDGLSPYLADKGSFDVLFECTGAPQALAGAIPALRPRAVIMQLGLGGDMPVPMMQITAKELEIRGSFRFHEEFALAVKLMQSGLVDVKPLISHSFSIDQAEQAFEVASDRTQAMKAQIVFAS